MPDDEDAPPDDATPEPEQPHAPFAPEDSYYAAIASEYAGLQRGGADPLGAALITAAHLLLLQMASTPAPEPEA